MEKESLNLCKKCGNIVRRVFGKGVYCDHCGKYLRDCEYGRERLLPANFSADYFEYSIFDDAYYVCDQKSDAMGFVCGWPVYVQYSSDSNKIMVSACRQDGHYNDIDNVLRHCCDDDEDIMCYVDYYMSTASWCVYFFYRPGREPEE